MLRNWIIITASVVLLSGCGEADSKEAIDISPAQRICVGQDLSGTVCHYFPRFSMCRNAPLGKEFCQCAHDQLTQWRSLTYDEMNLAIEVMREIEAFRSDRLFSTAVGSDFIFERFARQNDVTVQEVLGALGTYHRSFDIASEHCLVEK